MKNILIPTDFSEIGNTAIEYACEFAKAFGSSIFIVNIFTPAVTRNNVVKSLIEEEAGKARLLAEEKLKAICELIQQQYNSIPCKYAFKLGELLPSIEGLVDEYAIDFVVMGTHGATGADRILFGSNAAHTIERVICPVFTIPPESPFQPPKRIVYATDFNNEELTHMDRLISIAKAFEAEILVTHITTDESALLSEEMLKRNFAVRVSSITDYPNISYFVKYEENIERALQSFTEHIEADWIAILTHHRTFLEKIYNPSIAKALAYQTKVPLLALKN